LPNWCSNDVTLWNPDPEKIKGLEKELRKENPEPFQYLYPRPETADDDWYSWNIENWGTKWDVSVYNFDVLDENNIVLSFDSAWSPPIELYQYLEDNGWNVDALYHEPGLSFVGTYYNEQQNHIEYDFENENWRDSVTEEMIEYAGLEEEYENWLELNEDEG